MNRKLFAAVLALILAAFLGGCGSDVGSGGNEGKAPAFASVTDSGGAVWQKVSAGWYHTVALRGDGTVWAWGWNVYGQLGDSTTINRSTPVQAQGLTGVVAVSAGYAHTVAAKSDGTVWAWGCNYDGQLGDGTYTNRSTPVQVSGLTGVMAVAAGNSHTVALKDDGTVWTWGWNYYGQLGDGTTMRRLTPVQVPGLTGVTAVAVGDQHTLALQGDGTVWAWGWNYYGQLGDGLTANRYTPYQVLSGVTAIKGGERYTVALKGDGTVWAWGYNGYGQLGDGTTMNKYTPVQVGQEGQWLTGVTAVAAGNHHAVAVMNNGTVQAWGYNAFSQLGDGTMTNRPAPVQVWGLTGVTAVSAGIGYTVALKGDGTIWALGRNDYGQLGNGTRTEHHTPVQVQGPPLGVAAVSAGCTHTVVLRDDGTVWGWGSNGVGQLGDGATGTNRLTPVQTWGLTGVTAVSGSNSTIALKDGTVWAWGDNWYGQLGDNTTMNKYTPVQVQGLTGVVSVVSGETHTVALRNDGTVWAWGYNGNGCLGDGTTIERHTPVQVLVQVEPPVPLTGVTAVAVGEYHTVALKNDGTVWAWGGNAYGQLGDGTAYTHRLTPVQVQGLTGVTAVSAGMYHTAALKGDGTVRAWGWNAFGQLGDGTTIDRNTPVQVVVPVYPPVQPPVYEPLTGVVAVSASRYDTVALKGDTTVWAWGNNNYGQLGDGTTNNTSTPVQAQGLTGVTAISAGGWHTVAKKVDGALWAWGNNTNGQFGNGTTTGSLIPVQVIDP